MEGISKNSAILLIIFLKIFMNSSREKQLDIIKLLVNKLEKEGII